MRGKSYVDETGKSMKAVELAASQKGCWRKIASLTMSAVVKYLSSVLTRARRRARHFALVEGFAIPTKTRS